MNNQERSNLRALIVKKIAERRGLKTNSIYRILNGSRENEDVRAEFIETYQSVNQLLDEVNKTVPFYETSNS